MFVAGSRRQRTETGDVSIPSGLLGPPAERHVAHWERDAPSECRTPRPHAPAPTPGPTPPSAPGGVGPERERAHGHRRQADLGLHERLVPSRGADLGVGGCVGGVGTAYVDATPIWLGRAANPRGFCVGTLPRSRPTAPTRMASSRPARNLRVRGGADRHHADSRRATLQPLEAAELIRRAVAGKPGAVWSPA